MINHSSSVASSSKTHFSQQHSCFNFHSSVHIFQTKISYEMICQDCYLGVIMFVLRGLKWFSFNPKGFSSEIKSSLFPAPLLESPSLKDEPISAFSIQRFPHLFKNPCSFQAWFDWKTIFKTSQHTFFQVCHQTLLLWFLDDVFYLFEQIQILRIIVPVFFFFEPNLLHKQSANEVSKGWYSKNFHTLLPGTKVAPFFPGS